MFYSVIRFLFGWFIRLIFPFKVVGKERLINDGNTIVVCNHLNKKDVFYIALMFKGKTYFMAKKEWFDNKLLGWLLKKLGVFPVDREKVDKKAIKKGLEVLNSNNRLMIFPEGTRNKTDEPLLPLKDGPGYFAFKCNSRILPLTIYNKTKIFRRNYVYVGESFTIDSSDRKFTSEVNEEITEQVKVSLLQCRKEINEYMDKRKCKSK